MIGCLTLKEDDEDFWTKALCCSDLGHDSGYYLQRKRDFANKEALLDLKQAAVDFLQSESQAKYDLHYFMNNQTNILIDTSSLA